MEAPVDIVLSILEQFMNSNIQLANSGDQNAIMNINISQSMINLVYQARNQGYHMVNIHALCGNVFQNYNGQIPLWLLHPLSDWIERNRRQQQNYQQNYQRSNMNPSFNNNNILKNNNFNIMRKSEADFNDGSNFGTSFEVKRSNVTNNNIVSNNSQTVPKQTVVAKPSKPLTVKELETTKFRSKLIENDPSINVAKSNGKISLSDFRKEIKKNEYIREKLYFSNIEFLDKIFIVKDKSTAEKTINRFNEILSSFDIKKLLEFLNNDVYDNELIVMLNNVLTNFSNVCLKILLNETIAIDSFKEDYSDIIDIFNKRNVTEFSRTFEKVLYEFSKNLTITTNDYFASDDRINDCIPKSIAACFIYSSRPVLYISSTTLDQHLVVNDKKTIFNIDMNDESETLEFINNFLNSNRIKLLTIKTDENKFLLLSSDSNYFIGKSK